MLPWYLWFSWRDLVFPILLFSSISLHCSLRKAFLSLLAILWNSAFKWVYLSFSPLPLAYFLFSAICKASLDNHFAFCIFFPSLGLVLITASYTMSWTSNHSSSGTCPSHLIPWICLSLLLYKGFDRSYLNGLVVFPTFLNLNLNFAIMTSSSELSTVLMFSHCVSLLSIL